jgi:hypothetical protein
MATFKVFSNTDFVDLEKLGKSNNAVAETGMLFRQNRRNSFGTSISQQGMYAGGATAKDDSESVAKFTKQQPQAMGNKSVILPLETFEKADNDVFDTYDTDTAAWNEEKVAPFSPQPPFAAASAAANVGIGSQSEYSETFAHDEDAASRGVYSKNKSRDDSSERLRQQQYAASASRAAFSMPPSKPSYADEPEENDENAPEVLAEKEALLSELSSMEKNGTAKLARKFSMADSLQAIQFEYERIQLDQSAGQTVEMAKGGIRMGVGVIEMMLKNYGVPIDGWYNHSCGDMGKYNRPLRKLYMKYWRRAPTSPIIEIAYLILGSAAWTVVQNKVLGGSSSSQPSGGSIFHGGGEGTQQQQQQQPNPPAGVSASYEAPSFPDAKSRPPMRPPRRASVAGSSWGGASMVPSIVPATAEDIAAAAAQSAQIEALTKERDELKHFKTSMQTREREMFERMERLEERFVETSARFEQTRLEEADRILDVDDEPQLSRGGRALVVETTKPLNRAGGTATASRRAKPASIILRL